MTTLRIAKESMKPLQAQAFSLSEPLALITVCLDEDTGQSVRYFAESTSFVRLRVRRNEYWTAGNDSIREYIGEPFPDLCLVDFDRNRRNAATVAEQIHAAAPDTAIFAISSQPQPERIIEAMRSGCSEYLIKPLDREQLLNAIARVAARKKEKKDIYMGQVFAFVGAKGGCGATTLATQMGALLSSFFRKKTLVLDLHADFGDAALYLGLTKTDYHFLELLQNTDRLDPDFLHSFLVRHSSGLYLIPAPEGSEHSREVVPGAITRTVDFLRQRFECLVADLAPGFNNEHLELLRACDQIYIVTVAEVSAVRNVVRLIDYFEHKDVSKERIQVVLNRYEKRSVVSVEQIEKVIGQKIYWRVPNQYPQVVKTIHEGDPIAQLSNSEVTRNLKEWAAALVGRSNADEKKKESGKFLGLWNL